MAIIRATCGRCGDVELAVDDVTIRTCADSGEATYLFRCPVCRLVAVKRADEQVVELLSGAGVRVVSWNLPAELHERPSGPPITHDDLLEFHLLLRDDGWFHALVSHLER